MSTPAVTRPGRPRARFTLSRRWRRPVVAGLLIAETEYRHQVEGDIEPFRGILLALFFMTVGMTIDLGLVVREAPLVLSLVAALVLGKAVVLTGPDLRIA